MGKIVYREGGQVSKTWYKRHFSHYQSLYLLHNKGAIPYQNLGSCLVRDGTKRVFLVQKEI